MRYDVVQQPTGMMTECQKELVGMRPGDPHQRRVPRLDSIPPVEGMLERDPQVEQRMLQHQPIGRLGRAEEIAHAVVWRCSDRASLVVGTALAVDGGYLAA